MAWICPGSMLRMVVSASRVEEKNTWNRSPVMSSQRLSSSILSLAMTLWLRSAAQKSCHTSSALSSSQTMETLAPIP